MGEKQLMGGDTIVIYKMWLFSCSAHKSRTRLGYPVRLTGKRVGMDKRRSSFIHIIRLWNSLTQDVVIARS